MRIEVCFGSIDEMNKQGTYDANTKKMSPSLMLIRQVCIQKELKYDACAVLLENRFKSCKLRKEKRKDYREDKKQSIYLIINGKSLNLKERRVT